MVPGMFLEMACGVFEVVSGLVPHMFLEVDPGVVLAGGAALGW